MNIPEVVEGWVFFITKLFFPQDSDSTGADSNHAKTMAGSGKKHSGHHGDEDGANGKNGKGKKGSEDGEAAGEEGEDAGGKIRAEIFRSGTWDVLFEIIFIIILLLLVITLDIWIWIVVDL